MPNYKALPDFIAFSDLLNHVFAFLILFILFERAFPRLSVYGRVAFLFLFALSIELVQHFLPSRSASISDIAADAVGMMLALLLIPLLRKTPFLNRCYQY